MCNQDMMQPNKYIKKRPLWDDKDAQSAPETVEVPAETCPHERDRGEKE